MREFIKSFSQLKLNLPLCDFLLQVPKYARHLRDKIMKKDKLREASTHILEEECSALLTKKFVLPQKALADLILDLDEDVEFPILLGRPFLRTSRELIDMEKGNLVLRVGENKIVFKFSLLPSTSSKVRDTENIPRKCKERLKDDKKQRQLSSKVKERLIRVPVRYAKEAKAKKYLNDHVRGALLFLLLVPTLAPTGNVSFHRRTYGLL
ncbi:hypothetical protein M9H77_29544 [Catharanthus roseus]|uniref:Uncharacterized protein n=1 Tax=Catharanthus roseus TaxID=4058 RepID=A0ACB9ZW10_CATRO|nr:hypothetical protein M9H77_29544 [Catharanthus roseus]